MTLFSRAVPLAALCALLMSLAEAKTKSLSQPSAAEEALMALDVDKSGKVERRELESFAQSKGLTLQQVREEFKTIDLNGDGELEASEIRQTLDADSSSSAAADSQSASATAASLDATAGSMPAVNVVQAPVQEQPASIHMGGQQRFDALQVQELDAQAQRHAGRAVAELFEQRAAAALTAMREDSAKAEQLEQRARMLRGQADELRNTVAAQSEAAARAATDSVLKRVVSEVKVMDSEIASAESQAAESRKLSKKAMDDALAAQADISATVQRIKEGAAYP